MDCGLYYPLMLSKREVRSIGTDCILFLLNTRDLARRRHTRACISILLGFNANNCMMVVKFARCMGVILHHYLLFIFVFVVWIYQCPNTSHIQQQQQQELTEGGESEGKQ